MNIPKFRFSGKFTNIPLTGYYQLGGDSPGEVPPQDRYTLSNGKRRTTRQELDEIRDITYPFLKGSMITDVRVGDGETWQNLYATLQTQSGPLDSESLKPQMQKLDDEIKNELNKRHIPFDYKI